MKKPVCEADNCTNPATRILWLYEACTALSCDEDHEDITPWTEDDQDPLNEDNLQSHIAWGLEAGYRCFKGNEAFKK